MMNIHLLNIARPMSAWSRILLLAVMVSMASCSDVDPLGIGIAVQGMVQKENFSVMVEQPWDQPATRSLGAPVNDMVKADGGLDGTALYVYSTQLDGIQDFALPVTTSSQADTAITRGVLFGTAAHHFHSTFRVYSAIADANTEVRSDGTEWYVDKPLAWDGTSPATFYALAPYHDYAGVSVANPVLNYTTPAVAHDQSDIMAAVATGRQTDTELLFTFRHILSAVKVKIGEMGMDNTGDNTVIKQISLSGILTQGTYNVATDTWTPAATTGTVSEAADWEFSLAGLGTAPGTMITSDTQGTTFLLMPQTIPDGARISITIEKDGTEQTISAPLSGQWEQGHTRTYAITSSSVYPGYTLTVENASLTFDYNGAPVAGANKFIVTSHKNDNAHTPVPWKIDGYALGSDEYTASGGFTINNFTTSGTGTGVGGVEITLPTVYAQTPDITKNIRRRNELQDHPRPVKTTRFDLSRYMADNETPWPGGPCSANCYIVRQAGYYKIPRVAGNLLKNGVIQAYSGTGEATFVNHNGDKFKDNLIYRALLRDANDGKAEVIWEDAPGLVIVDPDIPMSRREEVGGEKIDYIYFEVPAANICQGNAVIAVKTSGGKIIWSYHIYVTDRDWTQTVPCHGLDTSGNDAPTYNFAPEFLGYVENEYADSYFPERTMRMRVTQPASGLTAQVNITQKEGQQRIIRPFSTLYQFGRKDAFPGTNTYYDASSNTVKLTSVKASVSIATSIMNPFTFYGGGSTTVSSDWLNVYKTNLWSAASTEEGRYSDNPVVKTIYDPSPAGFHVPPSNAFMFTTKQRNPGLTGVVSSKPDEPDKWNMENKFPFDDIRGYYVYTSSTSQEHTIYLPALGRRHCQNGDLKAVGSGGRAWMATSWDSGAACYMEFYNNSFRSRGNTGPKSNTDWDYRNVGFAVIPVADSD